MEIDPEGFAENVADKLGVLDRRVKADLKRFKAITIERHQIRKTPVTAEDDSAYFTLRLSARVTGWAITEIETRPHDISDVTAPILELVPVRIAI